MEFLFSKIYVKFYLAQINSSVSYYDHLVKAKELNDIDLMLEDDDLNPENMNFDENDQVENKEVNILYNKFFFFQNKIFSKVEVMGLVVETLNRGNDKNERFFITLDDSTSIIRCICWKNKNPFVYESVRNNIVRI